MVLGLSIKSIILFVAFYANVWMLSFILKLNPPLLPSAILKLRSQKRRSMIAVSNRTALSQIHIVHLLKGNQSIARANTMLKSLFYYQGRLDGSRNECSLQRIFSKRPCAQIGTSYRNYIRLHLVVQQEFHSEVIASYDKFNASDFEITLYDLNPYIVSH